MIVSKIYRLCNDKGYFTCGSGTQFHKMFDMAENGASAHDVALAIWICSDNKELDVIEAEIKEIFSEVRPTSNSEMFLAGDVIK